MPKIPSLLAQLVILFLICHYEHLPQLSINATTLALKFIITFWSSETGWSEHQTLIKFLLKWHKKCSRRLRNNEHNLPDCGLSRARRWSNKWKHAKLLMGRPSTDIPSLSADNKLSTDESKWPKTISLLTSKFTHCGINRCTLNNKYQFFSLSLFIVSLSGRLWGGGSVLGKRIN